MPAGAGWFSVISDKVKIPKYPLVDIGQESADLLKENTANLDEANAFARQFNAMSADQMMAQLEKLFPGYLDQSRENISSMLAGEVPADVQRQLEQKAAERGQSLGYGGSQFGENQFLRNFGLTSLQLTQQGLDSAMRWIGQANSMAPMFNMASAFLPIDQRINLRFQENQLKFQRDLLAAKVKAIPWGWKAVLGNVSNAVTDDLHQFGQMMAGYGASSMMGGGGMGGGGGGGGMGGPSNPASGAAQTNPNTFWAGYNTNYGAIKQDQSFSNYGLGY